MRLLGHPGFLGAKFSPRECTELPGWVSPGKHFDNNAERLRAYPAPGAPPAPAELNCLGSKAERYFHLRIPRTFPSVEKARNTNYGCSPPSG